ncbi:NAD(P)-binding domain-containing protein [Ureaplasma sp. ES3154-GEN]|uniref:NAD(P)H-dependent glycerol-3-phosphate dehydrogenase n=1 Tax=Ureaplasma sp. ES3154-GEN TaxID=2984844 RepID=UPI0021E8DFB8|nr:NAD(P)H-dependent glycerol-3-phosphate dehydrogenase [Ureaplasma sp. ES3154-GEN]MCV3743568.1 NAD(P)-binding domain-containing protein [Ureaplasma sp. ES3154-GEN]
MSKYLIIGSGAFGSALAQPLLFNGHQIDFYSINANELNEIKEHQTNSRYFRTNKFLHPINKIYNNLQTALIDNIYDVILLCVPSNALRSVIDILKTFDLRNQIILNAAKGMDLKTFQFWGDIIEKEVQCAAVFCLAGPSFAVEVFAQKPTKINILGANKTLAQQIKKDFQTPWFSLAFSSQTSSANFLASMKNVLAIGCGLVQGLYNSKNALCAYLTQGVKEILLFLKTIYQADVNDFISYFGFGDLILTCTDDKSRNFMFGFQLATNDALDLINNNCSTVEGLNALHGINDLLNKHQLTNECPLFYHLYKVVYEQGCIKKYISLIFAQD